MSILYYSFLRLGSFVQLKYVTLAFVLSMLMGIQQSNQEDFPNMPEVYGKTDSIYAVIGQGNGVIDLNGKMYVIDKHIDIWTDSITVQNGGFKRAATPQGDNPRLRTILNISGDTISFTNEQNSSAPTGAKVIRHAPLLRVSTPSPTHVVLKNIVFDGNVLENNHTHDWRFNPSVTSVKPGVTIDSCMFMNTPTENIFQCGGVIRNCRYYRLGGSFVHWSCKNGTPPPLSLVENNSGR